MTEIKRILDGEYIESGDGLDADTAAEFASFIDDMNSTDNADAWITVMRIPTDARGTPLPNSKHLGQLFNEPLGTSSVNDIMERIRRDYIRPGESSITVRIIGKQQGKQGLKFNRIYTIEKANASRTAEGGRESVGELGRMMLEMQRAADERAERFERLLLAARVEQKPSESIVDQLVKLAPILTPFISGVLGRPPVTGGGAAEMLAMVRAAKEMANMVGGKGEGDDGENTMKTIRAVAEVVGPGLKFLSAREERLTAAQRLQRARLPAPEVVAPKPAPPRPTHPGGKVTQSRPKTSAAPPPSNNTEENMNLKEMRQRVEMVCQLMDEGQTPEAVAELIVNNVEDDDLPELYDKFAPENFVAQIKILCPMVRGREEWFEKLRVAVLNQFEDDPDDTSNVPADGGGGATPEELAESPVNLEAIPDREALPNLSAIPDRSAES